ncbi:hypothetical protein EDD85DRAFT_793160 [Armillaria nabsnona]|nr:hypothetical protein EDD85DRAFT_793160 [Armillaria nabsnona]
MDPKGTTSTNTSTALEEQMLADSSEIVNAGLASESLDEMGTMASFNSMDKSSDLDEELDLPARVLAMVDVLEEETPCQWYKHDFPVEKQADIVYSRGKTSFEKIHNEQILTGAEVLGPFKDDEGLCEDSRAISSKVDDDVVPRLSNVAGLTSSVILASKGITLYNSFKATKWFAVANVKLEEGWFNSYEIKDGKATYNKPEIPYWMQSQIILSLSLWCCRPSTAASNVDSKAFSNTLNLPDQLSSMARPRKERSLPMSKDL